MQILPQTTSPEKKLKPKPDKAILKFLPTYYVLSYFNSVEEDAGENVFQ